MEKILRNAGIAKNIGKYSDGVEIVSPTRWLFSAGTPGMTPEGEMKQGIDLQTRQAWANIAALLANSDMDFSDLVKVTTTLTRKEDIVLYAKIRAEILGDLRPAFMLQVVEQMIRPEMLVEIEIVAAK